MGVVTDKLMVELREQLEAMQDTWTPPDVHAATLQDLEAATATRDTLQVRLDRSRLW